MKKNEQASLQILKVTIVTLILIFTCSMVVRAGSAKLNNVKIVLSNNYEMNVVTTKTNIEEILEENHIVVLPDETVFPSKESSLTTDNTIVISKAGSEASQIVKLANEEQAVSKEQILGNYAAIVEKIEVKEEVIPYETITKNTSSSSDERSNQVIRQGKDGLKEVTYKVKYQNDVEISRTVVKEKILKKAVNKVVQVDKTTSRSGDETNRTVKQEETKKEETTVKKEETTSKKEETAKKATKKKKSATGSKSVASKAASKYSLAKKVEGITPIVKTMNTSAYTASTCGKKKGSRGYGRTASGAYATSWHTVAAGRAYPMGTIIYIPAFKNKPNGGWFVVQDRGGAISNNRLDVYMSTYNQCIQFGRRNLQCYIYVK